MKRLILAMFAAVALSATVFAQVPAAPVAAPAAPQEVTVRIVQGEAPKPAPVAVTPPPAPTPEKALVQKATEWTELGTNLGQAMGSAVKSVLHETKDATFGKDVSVLEGVDRFSKSDVGRFTMLTVGWKIMGKDAVELTKLLTHTFFGFLALTVWTVTWFWFISKFCRVYSVKESVTGSFWSLSRKVTYKVIDEYDAGDKQGFAFGSTLVYCIGGAVIVGMLIL